MKLLPVHDLKIEPGSPAPNGSPREMIGGAWRARLAVAGGMALVLCLVSTASVVAAEPPAKSKSPTSSSTKERSAKRTATKDGQAVELVRTPDGGLQPQALIDSQGAVHLIYFKGQPAAGDIFYVRLKPGEKSPSAPIQVNSETGSAIATGTIRGAQLALGAANRVHVAWNGSNKATPKGPTGQSPMLYTRTDDSGAAFESQRNVIQHAYGLDGGGTVAADPEGNVYVAWHADAGAKNEAARRVWVARSSDEGRTFAREVSAFTEPTGACGCCGMRALADSSGKVYLVYRSAREKINRDIYLLTSSNHGESFQGEILGKWQIDACPMSSESFAESAAAIFTGWETNGQVFFGRVDRKTGKVGKSVPAPGGAAGRKHPALAVNQRGETILAWTEGTGWQRGGALAWQVFDATGKPTARKGRTDGIPVWSFATVYAKPDGQFVVVY